MKEILFVHDHKFFTNSSFVYSNGGLPSPTWDRFLSSFSHVTVLGRFSSALQAKELSNYTLSSAPLVDFFLIGRDTKSCSIVTSLFFKESRKKIHSLVLSSQAVCCRLPSLIGLYVFFYAHSKEIPVCLEVVGCPFDALKVLYGIPGRFVGYIFSLFQRLAVKRSKAIIYVTSSYLNKRYPCSPFSLVASISNVSIESVKKDARSFDAPLSSLTRPVIIGMIGNFSCDYKGHKFLFMAIRLLKDRGVSVEARILGRGSRQSLVHQIVNLGIENNVFIYDPLPSGSKVIEFIDHLDVYVQPSLTEGLPRSLIEAMSRGVPCIATDVGGIPELLSDDFLIPSGNAIALANKLQLLIQSSSLCESASALNLKTSKSYLSPILSSKRLEFYKEFSSLSGLY